MLYPIKFLPIYKSKIWGGTKLNEVYAREIPGTDIGEAWEVTCRDDGMSVVANGTLQGMTFRRLIETYGTAILGRTKTAKGQFPLLLKLLDVNSDLSVQVHPTADYIKENNLDGEEEKNEMWYVLYAEDNAKMISGVKKGTTKDSFAEAIQNGKIEDCLESTSVKTGDVIMISAGSVHAACSGMFIFELQQSSDTTYRLYDYNRRDSNGNLRRLDVEKALGTINYDHGVTFVDKGAFNERNDFSWRRLVTNQFFTLDEMNIKEKYRCKNNKECAVITCIEGECSVIANGTTVDVAPGDSILIPACIKNYTVVGKSTVLFSTMRPIVNYC